MDEWIKLNSTAKAWIDSNALVRCMSQLCTEACPRFYMCKEYKIEVQQLEGVEKNDTNKNL